MICNLLITSIVFITLGLEFAEGHPRGRNEHTAGLPLDPAVQAMIDSVSADTLFTNLQTLVGFHTRHTNSDTTSNVVGIGAARRWIRGQFQGYASNLATVDLLPSYFTFTESVCGITGEHRNVLATIPGVLTPDRHFIAMGHFDSRNEDNCDAAGYAPGANDDCSGTVVAMEMARVMSKFALESTMILMPVTGEEQGLYGSEAYADFALLQGMRIDGVLTNDIVANVEGCVDPDCPPGEPVIVDSMSVRHFSGDPEDGISRQLARYMKLQAERYVPDFTINLVEALDRPGRGGDHIPFYDRGFAAVRFTEAHESGNGSGTTGRQHNMFDTISTINTNKGYMANIVRISVAGFASLTFAPETPEGLTAFDVGNGQSVFLTWPLTQGEPDFAGYMIAQRNADSAYYEALFDIGLVNEHTVAGLTENQDVYFSLAAYDSGGNLSIFSEEVLMTPSSLPTAPSNVDATSRPADVAITWDPNSELDIASYRIYRSTMRNSGFVLYDSVSVPTTSYSDAGLVSQTLYYYQLRAVDNDGNEGSPSLTVSGQLATHDRGILVVDNTRDGSGVPNLPTDAMVDDQYLLLLSDFAIGGHYDIVDSAAASISISDADMAAFSTLVWHTDVRGSAPMYQDTSDLRKYMENGGRLLISGWRLSVSLMSGATIGRTVFPAGTFVPVWMKIDSTFTSGPFVEDFMAAIGTLAGYPDMSVDSLRIPQFDGALVNTDVVLPPFSDPSAEVLYTHHGEIPGSTLEGKPVGWRYFGTNYKLVVFDFPLYYMNAASAEAGLRQALVEMGEVTSVDEGDKALVPADFRLYQNFPNPFNPSTEIRFDLPVESRVTLKIYNLLGEEVHVLSNEEWPSGSHVLTWDGTAISGRPVSSGVYFYSIKVSPKNRDGEALVQVRRMMFLK